MSDQSTFAPRLSKRLAFKLARNVVLVSLLIGLLISAFSAYRDIHSTQKFFTLTVKQVIQTVNQPAARAAYNLNADLAGEVADGLMEYKSIISVTIHDDLHNTLSSKSQALKSSPYRWLAEDAFGGLQSYEIELRTLDDPEVKAGYLQVIADPIQTVGEFIDRTISEFIFNILRSLIVAGILSFVFYRLLVHPLQNIAHDLANTDPDNPEGTSLSVPKSNLGDELSILADSGNRLLNSISNRVKERDTAEAGLIKAAETLEQRIKERTAELAEQYEIAQAANKAKQEFLATMSHEIRTPMTAVMGFSDMLLDDDLQPQVREKIDKIRGATQSLLIIINDILDLSKIDSGQLKLIQNDFNFRSEIEKTIEIIARLADEKNLDLVVNISSEIDQRLNGDPTRIRQILINLLGNAVKFTKEGTVTLQVEKKSVPSGSVSTGLISHGPISHEAKPKGDIEEPRLIFRISDTGIGISENIIDKLFSPFTQADASISRRYEGTGLGLAISKRLTELMRGSIHINSTEGKGSIFEVNLPYIPAENEVEAEQVNAPTHEITYETQYPLSILVVDDNQLNRRIVQVIMEKNGHEIALAENGREAVDKLIQASTQSGQNDPLLPDLILMDIRMPEMSGPEATIAIRAMNGDVARLPIIALTADAVEDHVKEYYEAGMNAFVPKPIDTPTLLRAINQVMDKEIHKPVQLTIDASPKEVEELSSIKAGR
ncbi:ATP-binding protein [Kiloniella sp.]|uniref:ATP-binding protein n=1 Tax=Kiloniella sp. TaxID=1938587 RepID=UPI003B0255C3